MLPGAAGKSSSGATADDPSYRRQLESAPVGWTIRSNRPRHACRRGSPANMNGEAAMSRNIAGFYGTIPHPDTFFLPSRWAALCREPVLLVIWSQVINLWARPNNAGAAKFGKPRKGPRS